MGSRAFEKENGTGEVGSRYNCSNHTSCTMEAEFFSVHHMDSIKIRWSVSDGKQQQVRLHKHCTSFILLLTEPGTSDHQISPFLPPLRIYISYNQYRFYYIYQTQHKDAALIVVGGYNIAYLKHVVPNCYQHITCPTRGGTTLEHCYIQGQLLYKAQSRLPLGKSNHATIFLMPKWLKHWTDQSVATLTGTCSGTVQL